MKMKYISQLAVASTLLVSAVSAFASFGTGPTVLTMPSGIRTSTTDTAYAWINKPINFWGRVKWGDAAFGNYVLDCGNGATTSGAVANPDNIAMNCTYAAANKYFATLTVTDVSGFSHVQTTEIDVLPAMDIHAETNLAIERGLKRLYDVYLSRGKTGYIYESASHGVQGSNTAASVLAFENRGHLPAGDENSQIYVDLVNKGLDKVTEDLRLINISPQQAGNPDSNDNGIGYFENGVGTPQYTAGMMIMALVGSGDPDKLAATGPAAGKRYKDIVQDLVDYCAYAQAESNRGVNRGGWRYGTANFSSSDNSFSQWCPMGMDEASLAWGNEFSGFVKTENRFWTDYVQNPADGTSGYSNSTNGNWDNDFTGTASIIAQMSSQGRAVDDADIVLALSGLNSRWGSRYQNGFYSLYGVTKALRMTRDPANSAVRKTTDFVGANDWYADFSRFIIDRQRADGGWSDYGRNWVNGQSFSTAWAIEILTPALTGQPPVANAGGPYATPANVNVAVNGCASRHENPDKFLVTYEWDLDNDGTYDVSNAAPNCNVTVPAFAETGSDYSANITLRVTDNVGDTDTSSAQINITSGNIAPVANPGGPYVAAVGENITFDASGSTDPNAGGACGTIVQYEWDLDGNSVFEVNAGNSATYTQAFASAFSGLIGLRVTDDCGKTGVSSVFAEIAVTNVQLESANPYTVLTVQRLSRTLFRYTLIMNMTNTGNQLATNVVATLINSPANIVVESGPIGFGNVAPGASVSGVIPLVFRADRSIATQGVDMTWRLQYNNGDAVDINLPWLP